MSANPFFPQSEYDARLRAVRDYMSAHDLDICLISVPEDIYYLAGVNHWGFFAYHMLIVPREGEMVLIARRMETVTMDIQLVNARFMGYGDLDDQAQFTLEALASLGYTVRRVGIEKDSLYLPLNIVERIQAGLPGAVWLDVSEAVRTLRSTLSPPEVEYTRQAAKVSDAMLRAAVQTAGAGVNEKEVAAEVYRAMVSAGGEYPAFGPFIRSTPRLGEEHGTWTDRVLQNGDSLFVELSGCVARYHAPMGRLIYIGEAPANTAAIEQVCIDAFNDVTRAIRPGVTADDVYRAWQARVDGAGLSHYQRHHCGYMVGSAFPPAWSGGGVPRGLRRNSPMVLRAGMVFHILSWLMGTGQGDYFISDSVLVTENGCEVLTKYSQRLQVV